MPPTVDSPLRRFPRVATEGEATVRGTRGRMPVHRSVTVNVSLAEALLLTTAHQAEGVVLQVELGPPIFDPAILVPARVAHVVAASADQARQLGKQHAYLIGVEFLHLSAAQEAQLEAFIDDRLKDARQANKRSRRHTARERSMAANRQAPGWAYALGLFGGAFAVLRSEFIGQPDTTIALNALSAMVGSWVIGRVARGIWQTLEIWHAPAVQLVGQVAEDDPLQDADSEPGNVQEAPDPIASRRPAPRPVPSHTDPSGPVPAEGGGSFPLGSGFPEDVNPLPVATM